MQRCIKEFCADYIWCIGERYQEFLRAKDARGAEEIAVCGVGNELYTESAQYFLVTLVSEP